MVVVWESWYCCHVRINKEMSCKKKKKRCWANQINLGGPPSLKKIVQQHKRTTKDILNCSFQDPKHLKNKWRNKYFKSILNLALCKTCGYFQPKTVIVFSWYSWSKLWLYRIALEQMVDSYFLLKKKQSNFLEVFCSPGI